MPDAGVGGGSGKEVDRIRLKLWLPLLAVILLFLQAKQYALKVRLVKQIVKREVLKRFVAVLIVF
jgi:hypothetical protein